MPSVIHHYYGSFKGRAVGSCRVARPAPRTTTVIGDVTCRQCLRALSKQGRLPGQELASRGRPLQPKPPVRVLGFTMDEFHARLDARYRDRKKVKFPYVAPELLPARVQSDQVLALAEVIFELLSGEGP